MNSYAIPRNSREKRGSNKLAYNQDLIQLQRTIVVKVELDC